MSDNAKSCCSAEVKHAPSCHQEETPKVPSGCCGPAQQAETASCCEPKARIDWLLWGSLGLCAVFYLLALTGIGHDNWAGMLGHSVFELLNTMWWSVLVAMVFVGLLSKVPQSFVTSLLGRGGTTSGLLRATAAGVLMDLCSHGILMVGMQLRQKGASLGQVMAFLVASPWNSLSLTLILVALIGLPWTLLFILLSMLLALTTGWMFDRLEQRGVLPGNPVSQSLPENFHFWRDAKAGLAAVEWDRNFWRETTQAGWSGSKMVLRWLLFGVLLASLIRAFVSVEDFQTYAGPTVLGLIVTLIAATVIEVCSEGSTPIAADLMTRAGAPGNSFAFLMTGVATDYTEVMVIKDTTKSWKIALFLPLLTVPQVIVVALVLNQFS